MDARIRNIWKDTVWSNVIAGLISAAILALCGAAWTNLSSAVPELQALIQWLGVDVIVPRFWLLGAFLLGCGVVLVRSRARSSRRDVWQGQALQGEIKRIDTQLSLLQSDVAAVREREDVSRQKYDSLAGDVKKLASSNASAPAFPQLPSPTSHKPAAKVQNGNDYYSNLTNQLYSLEYRTPAVIASLTHRSREVLVALSELSKQCEYNQQSTIQLRLQLKAHWHGAAALKADIDSLVARGFAEKNVSGYRITKKGFAVAKEILQSLGWYT